MTEDSENPEEPYVTPTYFLLHIEDEDAIARDVAALLGDEYGIIHAHTLKEALDVLRTDQEFNAILLDLGLPGFQHIEAFDRLYEAIKTFVPPIPVIILTSNSLYENVRFPGGGRYLLKPDVFSRLPDVLKEVMHRS